MDEEAKKAIEFKRMLDRSQKEGRRFKLENEDLATQVYPHVCSHLLLIVRLIVRNTETPLASETSGFTMHVLWELIELEKDSGIKRLFLGSNTDEGGSHSQRRKSYRR